MSITAVPLRPIKPGSLAKLWAALALLMLVGIGVAVAQTRGGGELLPSGVRIETLKAGAGPTATIGDMVLVNYAGRLAASGKQFDSNMGGEPAAFPVAAVVPGFSEGLQHMRSGGRYRLYIPSKLAYGPEDQRDPATGQVAIPGNSDLVFDVDVHGIRPMPAGGMGMPPQQ